MATDENPRQLSVVIGEGLRKFRESRGLRQEDIANAAREYGFNWGRSSVAGLEAGNRDLSMSELLMIPSIIKKLGGWDEPLVPADARLQINESLWMPGSQIASHVFALLTPTALPKRLNEGPAPVADEVLLLGSIENEEYGQPRRGVIMRVSVYEYLYRKMWPERAETPWVSLTVSMEVTRKVGDRITTPDGKSADVGLVQAFALGMWGRTVGDERDARAESRGVYETKRALQSARGHVTRELIEELQEEITKRWTEVQEHIQYTREKISTDEGMEQWDNEAMRLFHPDWGSEMSDAASAHLARRGKFLRRK
ncbi:helix-turn-helix domain-containing protein [Streptomyces sp. NPDC058469]|uniref:helix-turn-helix domain-containing protein n=1 Tax=Streptomyces sp. NPDC058469 TaxID=3346514 RepID=UPI0036565E92